MPSPREGFIRVLVGDVEAALQRRTAEDTDRHRREAVRTVLAAIEGLLFIYREHIRDIAKNISNLDRGIDIALQEKTYVIGSKGELLENVRYNEITSMLRFVGKVAESQCGAKPIDFSDIGYARLRASIKVRNRLTHPKATTDLDVSEDEVSQAEDALLWLFREVTQGMAEANIRLIRFNSDAAELTEALARGDESAIADYRLAVAQLDD